MRGRARKATASAAAHPAVTHSSRRRAHTPPTLPAVASRHGRVAAMPGRSTLRYGGLAGSLLLAVAAYLRGAHAPWSPTMTARTILSGADGWLVPSCWLAGTLLLV